MKLIAEQIKYLRERRAVLLKKIQRYREYSSKRESLGLDYSSMCIHTDFQSDIEYQRNLNELDSINYLLCNSTIISERNFDIIDIGTRFSVKLNDSNKEKLNIVLIEANSPIVGIGYTREDSDFGKAVKGKKQGDKISYKVSTTNKEISLTITEIDSIHDNYEHFIFERSYTNRFSKPEKEELQRLKQEDLEEYQKRHELTKSQMALVEEEINSIEEKDRSLSTSKRRGFLGQMKKTPIAKLPEDESIGIGSIVNLTLIDPDGNIKDYSFELVNRAVSTELESHYVERISPLGHVIYGLHPKDTFILRRKHQPSITGIINSVDNNHNIKVK